MLERKHIEAIAIALNNVRDVRGHTIRTDGGICGLADVYLSISAALAACDESPCVEPDDEVYVSGVCIACGCTQYGTINCMEPCDCGGRELVVSFPPLPAAPEGAK